VEIISSTGPHLAAVIPLTRITTVRIRECCCSGRHRLAFFRVLARFRYWSAPSDGDLPQRTRRSNQNPQTAWTRSLAARRTGRDRS